MAIDVRLIVTDAPPLITLAVAKSLDYLLYPELPVIVPDAVFHEATAAAGKLERGKFSIGIARTWPRCVFDTNMLSAMMTPRPVLEARARCQVEACGTLEIMSGKAILDPNMTKIGLLPDVGLGYTIT